MELPRQAWVSIGWRTTWHMLIAVIVSVAISCLLLEIFSEGINDVGLLAAVVAPLALGTPMVLFMSIRHYQLEEAYRKLEASAARDSLTGCLNHGAFVQAVTADLEDAGSRGGALLVVDADHFKSINDRFGHASGDTALKLIAAAISGALREGDILGRLGGEEFGVFMPGASIETASAVADHIRLAVRTIEFEAGTGSCMLSVSIGGAVCAGANVFGDLFRRADERLYKVKETGRNNFDFVLLPPRPANTQPAPVPTELVYRGQRRRVMQG